MEGLEGLMNQHFETAIRQAANVDPSEGPVIARIQDAVAAAEQLTFFPNQDKRERKLRAVQRYLVSRFGENRLRRAVLAQPGAPLPEWRVGWLSEEGA